MHFINFLMLYLFLQSNMQGNFANMSCTWKSLKNIWERFIKHDSTKAQTQLAVNRLGDLISGCKWWGRHLYNWIVNKHCVSQCQCDYSGTSLRHTFLAVLGSGFYIAPGIFSRNVHCYDPLESIFRRWTLAIKLNLLTVSKAY